MSDNKLEALKDAIGTHKASYQLGYEAGRAAERRDVVAYLREVEALHTVETPIEPAPPRGDPMYGARSVQHFETADNIERGDHVALDAGTPQKASDR